MSMKKRPYYVPRGAQELRNWLKGHYVRRDIGGELCPGAQVPGQQAQAFCETHDLNYRSSETYTVARLARMLGRKMGKRPATSLYAEFFRIREGPRMRMNISEAGPIDQQGRI